jgi:hypothetical protein
LRGGPKGKARFILGVLVAPFEVTENKPMLDLLWRAAFRWRIWPRQVTGDSAYGTVENLAAVEKMGIRAYVALRGAGQGRPFFGKDEFAYDPERDLYTCPANESLPPRTRNIARSLIVYQARAGTCDACSLRSKCTTSKMGRRVLRHFDKEYVDWVNAYRGAFPYQKALRKRRVWVELLFAEAKDWHGMRRFRLIGLEKVNAEALMAEASNCAPGRCWPGRIRCSARRPLARRSSVQRSCSSGNSGGVCLPQVLAPISIK